MKLTVTEDSSIQLEEVFSGVTLKTGSDEIMSICMRDSGFEFNYQGKWYSAKEGNILPMGEVMTDQQAYYLGLRDKPEEIKKEEPVWINKDPVAAYKEELQIKSNQVLELSEQVDLQHEMIKKDKEEIEALKEALRKVLNNCGYAMHSDLKEEIEQLLK